MGEKGWGGQGRVRNSALLVIELQVRPIVDSVWSKGVKESLLGAPSQPSHLSQLGHSGRSHFGLVTGNIFSLKTSESALIQCPYLLVEGVVVRKLCKRSCCVFGGCCGCYLIPVQLLLYFRKI